MHGSLLADDLGETKVSQLDLAVLLGRLEQKVLRLRHESEVGEVVSRRFRASRCWRRLVAYLEVAVSNVEIVEVLERQNELLGQDGGIALGVRALGDDAVEQLATRDAVVFKRLLEGEESSGSSSGSDEMAMAMAMATATYSSVTMYKNSSVSKRSCKRMMLG